MKDKELEFPTSIFPEKIRTIIEETNSAYHYPISYIAAALLFAVASAIGNTRVLVIDGSWRVKAVLYMALVGGPGAMKTHPIKFAIAPFLKLDELSLGKYKKELQEWRNSPLETRGEKPIPQQLRVQDITMEAITKILEYNRHGIFVFVDELKGWISSFNQYRGSGGDQEQWISIYSGVPITVNRKTQDEIPFIKDPYVSVIGGLQPGIIPKLFSGEKIDNGFFNRILFVGNSSEGIPLLWGNDEDLPLDADEQWGKIINTILQSGGYLDDNFIVSEYYFSRMAWEFICVWQNTIEKHNAESEPEYKIGIFRKIQDYCLRFALIIHTMREATGEIPESREIDLNTASRATKLADYFLEQAQIAYELITTGNVENEKFFMLLNGLNDSFTTQQALVVGERMGISRPTVYRLLAVGPNDPFLRKTRHGHYEKIL